MKRSAWTVALLLAASGLAGCVTPASDAPPSPFRAPSLLCAPCRGAVEAGPTWSREPMVAVDPSDPDHIVVGAQELEVDDAGNRVSSWDVAYVTFDGGATWAASRLPGGPGAGLDHPLAAAGSMTDPFPLILLDGTVLFAGLFSPVIVARALPDGSAVVAPGVSLFVARSTDGGRTFPEVPLVARGAGMFSGAFSGDVGAPGTFLVHDKPALAAGPEGTVLLAWSRHDAIPAATEVLWSASRDNLST